MTGLWISRIIIFSFCEGRREITGEWSIFKNDCVDRKKKEGAEMEKDVKWKSIQLVVGAALYFNALYSRVHWELTKEAEQVLFLAAYAVLAGGIFWQFLKQVRQMQFFDENLLMILATVGALLVNRYTEAVGAMLFFHIGKLIEAVSLNRTKRSIARFIDIRPVYANRKKGSSEEVVKPGELKQGQIIIIRSGEKVPVDAVVTHGSSTVDMKALTGESRPRAVEIGSRLYSGSINLGSVLEARVFRVDEESMASRILKLVEEAAQKKGESENFADKFTKCYTPIVILMGILVMVLPPMMLPGHDTETWMYRGLIFLVAACPCGLLVSIPLALLGGMGAASRQGIVIKGGNYLEALSRIDTFVFDKTGTLTEGIFSVKDICPRGITAAELLEYTAYGEMYSNHPIAVSLREAYGGEIDMHRVEYINEYSGFGVEAVIDGKKVVIGNSKFMNRNGLFYHPVSEIGTAVHVAIEREYVGYILISDALREDAGRTVKWLQRHHLEAVMFTGDNERVAKDVAKKLGISYVYSNMMPQDKVAQMEEFMESQMESEKLAFVGDGINDAPVLMRADVGIAMGGLGADAALEAADIILMEDEPSKIVNAIRISRGTLRAVRQNVYFAVGIKVILLTLAFFGYVSMQKAIIADMAVLLINILNSFWVLKYPE